MKHGRNGRGHVVYRWPRRGGWSKANANLKTRFIANPRSGRAARLLPPLRDYLRRHGGELVLTGHPGHARTLAATAVAEGCGAVVAVGGDGTVNEVACALAGTSAALGLVPAGSGNGLARELGLHRPLAEVLAIIHAGHTRVIDSGVADGHPFFVVAGLGFEAELARRFNAARRRGFAAYLALGAAALRHQAPRRYRITTGGETIEVLASTLAIANARQYGNQALIAPHARIDDGLLDLCAVPPIGLLNALPLVWRLFAGTLDHAPTVTCRRAATFRVAADGPLVLHTDGETHLAGPEVEFTVHPAQLRVLCPPVARAG